MNRTPAYWPARIMLAAEQELFHDPTRPSAILLPVV
jgi:hypothetical protein